MASKNNLKTLPVEMSQLRAIEIVDFAYNSLLSIPVALTATLNLRTLDLSFNNQLAEYPSEIKSLKALRLLNLKSTKITAKQVDDLEWLVPDCQIML